jgi:hypothetical protein
LFACLSVKRLKLSVRPAKIVDVFLAFFRSRFPPVRAIVLTVEADRERFF